MHSHLHALPSESGLQFQSTGGAQPGTHEEKIEKSVPLWVDADRHSVRSGADCSGPSVRRKVIRRRSFPAETHLTRKAREPIRTHALAPRLQKRLVEHAPAASDW